MAEVYGVPITGLAGDQQAALFGQSCLDAGTVKCTYGTGCFVLMQTGESCVTPQEGLLSTIAWKLNGQTKFALEGSVFMAGAVLKWLCEELELVRDVEELDRLAQSVADSGGRFGSRFHRLGSALLGSECAWNNLWLRAQLQSIAYLSSCYRCHCLTM